MVLQSPDPVELEKLDLRLVSGTVVDSEGRIVEASRLKDIKKKTNWNVIGPGIAVLLFIFTWGTVVSERAFTATVNTGKIAQQSITIQRQDTQIDQLRKGNERQEIMMKGQNQILDKQDKVMQSREKYMDKRLDAVEREVIGKLTTLTLQMDELGEDMRELAIIREDVIELSQTMERFKQEMSKYRKVLEAHRNKKKQTK